MSTIPETATHLLEQLERDASEWPWSVTLEMEAGEVLVVRRHTTARDYHFSPSITTYRLMPGAIAINRAGAVRALEALIRREQEAAVVAAGMATTTHIGYTEEF